MSQAQQQVGPPLQRKAVRIHFLPVLFVLVLLAALWAATQTYAHALGYAPPLGQSLNGIYPPWMIGVWLYEWPGLYHDALRRAGAVAFLFAAVGLLALSLGRIIASNSLKRVVNMHGSARWAVKDEIVKAGLLPAKRPIIELTRSYAKASEQGVYVGGWEDRDGTFRYLRHNGPEHVLTYAPTRSGKGVGLVIPTLLSWPESVVVTDLKGELWELTSGWRALHAKNRTLRFEPASSTPGGVRWNALDEVRIDTDHEVGDVQNIVTLIVDPDGRGLESHWQKTAFALLVGVVLHALYKARRERDMAPATLPLIDHMLADPSRPIVELWKEMASYSHRDGDVHPAVGAAARDMLDRPEEEAGSVLSTAKSYLSLYRDPVVARNVSTSDFSIHDLMNDRRPLSLYIVTTGDDKTRLRPLVRIFLSMIVRKLAGRMSFEDGRPVNTHRWRMLGMLDEFPALGKIEILQDSLSYIAGYGIKFYLIAQDLNQLKSREAYGPDETITSSCHVQNAFPPNRIETAEHLSKLTGTSTVSKENVTVSGNRSALFANRVSRSTQEVQRPLLTPDECLRMPEAHKDDTGQIDEPGDMLIYVTGCPMIYGKQPLYFKDPVFAARAAIAPPGPKAKTDQTEKAPVPALSV